MVSSVNVMHPGFPSHFYSSVTDVKISKHLICVCFNLYCGGFILFCYVCVCVCVCVYVLVL